jgi:hypothetical protein
MEVRGIRTQQSLCFGDGALVQRRPVNVKLIGRTGNRARLHRFEGGWLYPTPGRGVRTDTYHLIPVFIQSLGRLWQRQSLSRLIGQSRERLDGTLVQKI